jgi:hypothetical protein
MPSVGSWDGKWSGQDKLYVRIIHFGRSKEKITQAERILDKGYFHYNFGDGWSAGVSVKEVDRKEAMRLRGNSDGFCGYDWMVQSIIDNMKIAV